MDTRVAKIGLPADDLLLLSSAVSYLVKGVRYNLFCRGYCVVVN